MPTSQQPAAPAPGDRRKQEKQGRGRFLWTRRLSFLCCWFVLIAACLAALAAGLLLIGYHNATPIANLAREQLAPDLPIEVGSVSFPERGVIELRDIKVDLPGGGRRAGDIERIRIGYDESDITSLKPRARTLLVERPNFVLDDALLAMFASDRDSEAPPPKLNWAKLDALQIIDGRVEFELQGIPRGSWRVDLEAEDIDLGGEGAFLSRQPQHITLRDFAVAAPEGGRESSPITVEEITAELALNKGFTSGAVAKLHLKRPAVRFTPAFMAALQPAERTSPLPAEPASAGNRRPAPMRWSIDEIFLEDGHFAMAGFYDTPDVSFDHSGKFTDLTWSSDRGLNWPGEQQATLTEVRVDARALPIEEAAAQNLAGDLLAYAPRIDIAGVPDEFFAHGWIDRITTRKPMIHASEEHLRRFFTAAPDDRSKLLMPPGDAGEADPAGAPANTPNSESDFLIRVRELEVADAELKIEADGFLGGLPESTLIVNLRSSEEQRVPAEDVDYLLSATRLKVYTPGAPQTPIISGTEILTEFSAAGVQRNQRIDRVTFSGLDVRIGEEVERIIAGLDPPTPTADDAETGDPEHRNLRRGCSRRRRHRFVSPEWKIGKLELEEARFTLEKFIPGLPYVPLVLETSLDEVPLSGRNRGDERPQKVELRNLVIASPYNSLLPVAKLRSIWVHFTVPGLIRNEIEKVEIVSPEIYLGEHLFWYIDYYRKFANNESDPGAASEEEKLVAISVDPCAPLGDEAGEDGEGKIDAIENALKHTEISGWKINGVEASTGSLIVAPKGYPIGILPFPFSAKTDLAVGRIELDLKVPESDYVFEELKLELRGLNGEAFFNYPIRQEDNNFVQTFTVPEFLYQDYRADDVFLSITYTEELIHGELGGAAYGGYANGEFNIYIGETYKWDAWVTGTGLELGPISEILAPETIKVTGILDAKIIAEGEGLIPAKITGTMNTSGPAT